MTNQDTACTFACYDNKEGHIPPCPFAHCLPIPRVGTDLIFFAKFVKTRLHSICQTKCGSRISHPLNDSKVKYNYMLVVHNVWPWIFWKNLLKNLPAHFCHLMMMFFCEFMTSFSYAHTYQSQHKSDYNHEVWQKIDSFCMIVYLSQCWNCCLGIWCWCSLG